MEAADSRFRGNDNKKPKCKNQRPKNKSTKSKINHKLQALNHKQIQNYKLQTTYDWRLNKDYLFTEVMFQNSNFKIESKFSRYARSRKAGKILN